MIIFTGKSESTAARVIDPGLYSCTAYGTTDQCIALLFACCCFAASPAPPRAGCLPAWLTNCHLAECCTQASAAAPGLIVWHILQCLYVPSCMVDVLACCRQWETQTTMLWCIHLATQMRLGSMPITSLCLRG